MSTICTRTKDGELQSVFVSRGKLHHISSLILWGGGGGGGRKSDLSFHGQLMMSYHYTQILRSPSKPAPLRADWLLRCERGRVLFFFFFLPPFPLAPGLIPVLEWAHLSCFSLPCNLCQNNSYCQCKLDDLTACSAAWRWRGVSVRLLHLSVE